ncbi:YgiW/YdeI family stress tolerance OB fold protein [Pseudomonas sp. NPDC086251]|uniref:YgiW/YdeI family stress tolerance OB fold protein n=1 Tax=Pseudomonas sp. NPDC086251 TaxID=3364431 RepID=UPI003832FE39
MKRSLLAALSITVFSSTAFAAGGYTGPSATVPIVTTAAANQASDDTRVVLEGTIVKRLKKDQFEFKDSTGTITVEIKKKLWPEVAISDVTKVRLTGEIDRDWFDRKVDVKQIELTN